MNLTLKLKPSLLGQYYEKQCDKFLVYNAVDKGQYKKLGWIEPEGFKQTAAALAGMEWEKILYDRLAADDTCEIINLKNNDDQEVTLDNTVETLKGLNAKDKTIYLYQACFSVTDSFAKEYLSGFDGKESKAVFSSRMFPDFIKAEYIHAEGKYRLTIIDAKNASILKIGAEVQIALYVRILKGIIADKGIDNCYVNEVEGIVWNREKITDNRIEHIFKIHDAENELDAFFNEKLIDICDVIDSCRTGSQMQKKLDYRISQKCEYCENFETCKNHCIDEGNVRLMPYITNEAQNRIMELMDDGTLQDDSFESVKDILENQPDLLTEDCSYWKNVKNNLEAYEKGLNSFFDGKKERFAKVGSSISFPKGQNFALFLTAQQDVNSGRAYAYAWYVKPGKQIDIFDIGLNDNGYVQIGESKNGCPGKGTYYNSVVAENNTVEEFDRIDRAFVEGIYEILEKISNYQDQKKRKLQCFVMDDYELTNIENTLFNMLGNLDSEKEQILLEKVMAILFWMQGERLVTDSDLEPEETVDNPVTVITSEISRLYVLSEGVSYSLKKTASIFSPSYNFDDDKSGYFGILSNVVDGMPILYAWKEKNEKQKAQKLEWLGSHLRKRLFVEANIVSTVQADNNDNFIHLSAWPAQYKMQSPKYPNYPEIARLDFENRYEELLTYHQIRMARMAGIQNAIDNGTILSLEYTGRGNTYQIINSENYVGREWFSAWLCEDTPENRLQILLLRDTDYTANPKLKFLKKYSVRDTNTVFYPTDFDQNYNFTDDGVHATVDFLAKKGSEFNPQTEKKYLFFEVYSDMNSTKTAVGISNLVGRQELLNPVSMSNSTGITFNNHIENICSRYWSPDGFSFSPSQKEAFVHLLEQKLNVLVGPPASGKTDFIARALITIASYYKVEHEKNLKIMVTAMSHSAIENVLLKLDKMLQNNNPCGIKVYKASRYDDEQAFNGKSVELWKDKTIAGHLSEDEIQIVGMTSWSAYKEFHDAKNGSMCHFDMIVMDEASQVRAMDAFLNLECSDENTRFLLVGDDDQLPPIIGGKYKQVEGEKYIHGSIFRMYISGLGDGHPDIVKLSDNFRMNGILCKYPSEAIYGPSYKAFNDKIKKQKISLKKKADDDLIASILDEDYPLVFCELSGIAREQHDAEVTLVTDIVHELWESEQNPQTNNLASADGNFWRDSASDDGELMEGACGIITPHHEHINRLKTSISNDLGLDRKEIYIGTVDKLQGKERKAVIVSYGVSENEKIMSESEFIFSSNRFNVSITRGKAKTIIFLSDAIAEPNLTTNIMTANDPALKKGIDFIHGFASYMKRCEDGEEMIAEDYPFVVGEVSLKVWKKRLAGT